MMEYVEARICDAIEALERGSTTAPVIESLRAVLVAARAGATNPDGSDYHLRNTVDDIRAEGFAAGIEAAAKAYKDYFINTDDARPNHTSAIRAALAAAQAGAPDPRSMAWPTGLEMETMHNEGHRQGFATGIEAAEEVARNHAGEIARKIADAIRALRPAAQAGATKYPDDWRLVGRERDSLRAQGFAAGIEAVIKGGYCSNEMRARALRPAGAP